MTAVQGLRLCSLPGAPRRPAGEEGTARGDEGGQATVSSEELLLAHPFELAALVNAVERKGLITQRETLDEIRRLRGRAGKAL